MTLETLVQEIESRSAQELKAVEEKGQHDIRVLATRSQEEVGHLRTEWEKRTGLEAGRERARLLASAKLQAKKVLFEAREKRVAGGLDEVRQQLASFTRTPEYPKVLASMVTLGTATLGSDVKVRVRKEDASLLGSAASKLVDTSRPLTGLGGIVVEKNDGSRSLNLSFEELLRIREDRVREILGR